MSIVPVTETVKDTIEILNEIYQIPGLETKWITFLEFFLKITLDGFLYFVSFRWIHDFVQLPILLPSMAESFFSEKPHLPLGFFTKELSKNFIGTSFFSGFFNCFFLYFPLSPIHIIWLRYVLLDGQECLWVGRAATLGLIIGNLSFFGVCFLGWRWMIHLWFGCEPFSYFFGVWLVLKVIFELNHRRSILQTRYQPKQLWTIFFIHFGCVWTDQSGFYPFFGNLSVQSSFSLLDFAHSSYLVYFGGLCVGSVFWTFLIIQICFFVGYILIKIIPYTYSSWVRGWHYFCLIGCVTATFTSFAFYGTDYLFTNPIGFVPQDQGLELVSLSTQTKDTSQGRLGEKSSFGSVDTDLSSFDRGRYAGGPLVEFHIESLNYQDEYAWRSRIDRFSSRGLNRKGGILDQYITTQLGPTDHVLKRQRKQKRREQQIQKLKKQREKMDFLSMDKDSFAELPYAPLFLFENNSMEFFRQLIERYILDYSAEAFIEDSEIPNLPNEKMIRYSAFSELAKYGFDIFSTVDSVELDPFDEELTRDLKEKFSENMINKFLIRLDINHFLHRQSPSYQLTSNEEISLFQKRLFLANYFDTLRTYCELPNIFQPLFYGPKSYVNRVYNQQFKGTLKIVERLFSVHLEHIFKIPALPKIDIDLVLAQLKRYQQIKDSTTPWRPSRRPSSQPPQPPQPPQQNSNLNQKKGINLILDELRDSDYLEKEYLKLKNEQKEVSVLKFDQPLYKTQFLQQNTLIHEQSLDHMPSLISEADFQPFLQEGNAFPFFVGWDNEQKKFIVTNRLLTQENTLSKLTLPKKTKKKTDSKNAFNFITWPVTKKALQNQPFFNRFFNTPEEMVNTAEDIFKYAEPGMEEDTLIYQQLPYIVRRIGLELKDQPYLAPKRGGFIWSGNEPLKYPLPKFIKKLLEMVENRK